jgi:uncharacterized protein (TIGR01777 family)
MNIFVTGGTGLVGGRLINRLEARQDQVVLLTRRPEVARARFAPSVSVVEGDPTKAGAWMDAVPECDAVVNLAGENLFKGRWKDEFRKVILESRVQSTKNLVQALSRDPVADNGAARVLVNASAIGWYGFHEQEELTEDSPPGNDFLAGVCAEWENAARVAESSGARVVLLRIGVVLDKEGGALGKMLTPFKMGAGGPIGSGRQWMSWIHHDDLVGLILLALDRADVRGPLNGTAPNPVTNKEFASALGRALHRPSFIWTPGVMLKLMLGGSADIILQGQRVVPKKALALGYEFRFSDIDPALTDLLA